jgi:Skp family chaperone for outer membrane proteins
MRSAHGDGIRQDEVDAARRAYKLAREAYLEKARELASQRRRRDRPGAVPESARNVAPDEDRSRAPKAPGSRTHASAAAVGSIDMDAVFKRYAKVVEAHKRNAADAQSKRARLRLLQADVEEEAALMQKFVPGSKDHAAHEARLASLKQRIESEREAAERELMSRQSRQAATLLEEIQAVIADIARTKGFDFVVRADAGPQPDASHDDVMTALKRSVLYANPRNDITEEVIQELNRRYATDDDKTP